MEAAGGEATALTSLDRSRGETGHRFPSFLPDGRHFLYHSVTGSHEQRGVYVGSLDSKEVKRLVGGESGAEFGQGNLLFVRNDTLMAQRLDLQRLETAGSASPVAEDVAFCFTTGKAFFHLRERGARIPDGRSARRHAAHLVRPKRQTGRCPG